MTSGLERQRSQVGTVIEDCSVCGVHGEFTIWESWLPSKSLLHGTRRTDVRTSRRCESCGYRFPDAGS